MRIFLFCALFSLSFCFFATAQKQRPEKPNIIILYADDLGYGDVGCYGAVGVKTPNIDKLARTGLKFTDAHSSAATCTPSRFSMLTGTNAFRNKAKILPGDAPLLIRPGTPTLPDMLQKAGYKTAVVGKWHLGLGDGNINWNAEIKPGAKEVGFEYSFLLPATGDRVPTVYLENGKVVGAETADPIEVNYLKKVGNDATGFDHPELLRIKADSEHSNTIVNGVSRIGYMSGGKSARWVDEEFPDILTQKALTFIKENKEQPFFLYYSFHDIHVPRLPHPRFKGKSEMGPRGDAIVQVDWVTGEIVKALEEMKLDKNTLIIFTSDNGPVLNDGYEDRSEELVGNHKPAGPFRGGKYSVYEGGTRVPMIAWWPSKITPAIANALFSQVDLFASLTKLVGGSLVKSAAPDSQNLLKALLGQSKHGRDEMIEEAFVIALRQGKWKYIEPGNAAPQFLSNKKVESGLSDVPQLYNLDDDSKEQNNLSAKYPEKVKALKKRLDQIRNKQDE